MNHREVLRHPQALRFAENHLYRDDWNTSGGRVVELPTGHVVFYGNHGLRILMVDPHGNPLHECAWIVDSVASIPSLRAARLCLDWGQWVGIKPEGLVNTMTLDLSTRPGWEHVTAHDLRLMAARAMHMDLETIQFFYRDEDLSLKANGEAVIRQVKDAFYVLEDGDFEKRTFMSCMSRMRWGGIDYLPVVELFLSLLPGTGSATFELIRQLYDDQNTHSPKPLHYRGIPVYPSEAAFRLFSLFFSPSLPSGEPPKDVFLLPSRSHEVIWNPSHDFPVRYLDETTGIGLTIYGQNLQKVTVWEDQSGLSFFPLRPDGTAPSHGRAFQPTDDGLTLYDGAHVSLVKVSGVGSGHIPAVTAPWRAPSSNWKDCFKEGLPHVESREAFSTVLLYPDQDIEIGENATQPFVLDFWDDMLEENPGLSQRRTGANHIHIVNCEAGLGACLTYTRPQAFSVWYRFPAFAQKYAQQAWNRLSQSNHLEWFEQFEFRPFSQALLNQREPGGDWLYLWIPFSDYNHEGSLREWTVWIQNILNPNGIGCVVGPSGLGNLLEEIPVSLIHVERGENLPTFQIHRSILPHGYLNPEVTVWLIERH